jgi:photosystem II stability/assembly factor-like uncharacterized protein
MDAQRSRYYFVEISQFHRRSIHGLGRICLSICLWVAQCSMAIPKDSYPSGSDADAGVSASVSDTSLHDCVMLSIDRALAVGDAGAILVTEDGGKQWRNLSNTRSEMNYYGVGMDVPIAADRPRTGLIVGGTIQPASGGSVGVVLTTEDDGITWTSSTFPGLPRLIGLQRVKHRHWIAWGDWSDHFGSALFESIDGGRSWNPRSIPCGHLQSVALGEDGATLVVDRASRVFYAANGVEFRSVNIPSDQFHPIRFCKRLSSGWWMGGDGAQLWHSPDGLAWQRVELPIASEDKPLVDCLQIDGNARSLWVVGKPANAIWQSQDDGRSWTKRSTGATTVLNSIKAWDDQVLMACGRLGNIHQSRNGGLSWRETHASSKRYLGLSLSATDQTIPWDIHAYITHEGFHQTAAVVLHDRRFSETLHHQIDRSSALACLASRARLDHISTWRGLPISDMPNGSKVNDLAYYQHTRESLLRMMVQEIRLHRPDVLIIEDKSSTNMLRSACGALASQAVQLAGNPTYMPTKSLGDAQPGAWTVQRILENSENGSGFALSASMLLKKSNQLLAKPLQPIRYYYGGAGSYSEFEPSLSLVGKARYRLLNHSSTSISHPLDGLVVQGETKLCEKPIQKTKLSTLMASANSSAAVSELLKTRGSSIYRETAWEDSLAELIKPMSPESTLDVLWMVSQESRKAGNWNRWHSALQMMLARFPNQEQQELAYRELMTYLGSAEVDQMVRLQLQHRSESQQSESPVVAGSGIASPFSTPDSGVKTASYATEAGLTPLARGQSEKEFSKLLGIWPDDWKHKQSEPGLAWLIASRFRTSSMTRTGRLDHASEREFWPMYFPYLGNWSGIHEQEQIVNAPPEGALPVPRIPWVASRPHLDGIAESDFWSQAASLRLSTAWADETETSTLRICRDSEFLFLHVSAPKNRISELAWSGSANKKEGYDKDLKGRRDSIDQQLDHMKLRIDIDRDYATWFEFGWDSYGGLSDRCNDILMWDPQWYIVLQTNDSEWSAELAIPISELVGDSAIMWDELPWAISLQRECPSMSTEFLVAGDSDRWGPDQWLIINPAQP